VQRREYLLILSFISQTKPGPNIELAVMTNSRLRVSIEEKELSSCVWSVVGISVGVGVRHWKKKWLLCAIEA